MPAPSLRHLFHPDNVEEYLSSISAGAGHLAETLTAVSGASTGTTPAEAAGPVAEIDLDSPSADLGETLSELSRVYLDDAIWFHEPSYAAHLNCPVVIPALLAELFVSSVNSSLDTFDQSVGATHIERRLIDWTAARIGMSPPRADGIFTSGGTQSNLQALLLARDTVTAHHGAGLDRLRVFVSADGHFSVTKSVRLLGLSPEAVVPVPVDQSHRMRVPDLVEALQECLEAGLVPMAVVATAGTTDFGAIDPLRRISEVCAMVDTWLHVDAAYGGGLLASRRRRHLLDGIELADSVTVDFHKTWFLPVSASAIVVRDGRTLRHVTHHADYLNPREATDPNQVDKSLQTTRRFDALKLWMALRIMGPDALGDYFDAAIDLAHAVHQEMLSLPDVEVAAAPGLSTLVFRCSRSDLPEEVLGDLNARIRAELYRRGDGMVAATKLDGSTWLKITLLNPRARAEDILAIVADIRSIGAQLAPLEPALEGGGVMHVHDFVGIGIGPFNLGLACLSEPLELDGVFLESSDDFDWHPGMLLDDATLQVPFMADLVTMADPTSPYSFLAFLKDTGHLYSFYIRESFYPLRREYNEYCRWAAERLISLRFGRHVERVEHVGDHYAVHAATGEVFHGRRIVLGVGSRPVVPEVARDLLDSEEGTTDGPGSVLHSADYVRHREALRHLASVTVVGSGQSAAEVYADLLDTLAPGQALNWVTRSPRFFPMEYTKLTLELTSPEYTAYFQGLPEDTRASLLQDQKSLYKGISSDLVDAIFDKLYEKRVSGGADTTLVTGAELMAARAEGSAYVLDLHHHESGQDFAMRTDAVVLATGYATQVPGFLEPVRDRIRWDERGRFAASPTYAVDLDGTEIFVQNAEEHTHGFVAPDLGMGAHRNATLIAAMLGREVYRVEKQIAFQQFGVPDHLRVLQESDG